MDLLFLYEIFYIDFKYIAFVLACHLRLDDNKIPSNLVSSKHSKISPFLNANSGGKSYFLDLLKIITFDFDSLIFI